MSDEEQFFGGATVKLQAADLTRPLATGQVQALEAFLTSHPFYRFATMAASSCSNTTRAPLIQLLGHSIWQHIADIASRTQPTEVVVVIEDFERLRKELYGYIAGYEVGNEQIRIKPHLLGKEECQAVIYGTV